jgi:hypothetical protein
MNNRFWKLEPASKELNNYIPDEQELAEWAYLEELQEQCKHENFNDEDGCLDCGYYTK